MKKLLSALFILGSVAALGSEDLESQHKPPVDCYEQAVCRVEKDVNLKVKVPKVLKVTGGDIDFLTWCGTRPVTKTSTYNLEGEPGARVNVSINTSPVSFKHESGAASGFTANLNLDNSHKDLHATAGTASGTITASLVPGSGKPLTGHHTAKATLVAFYDSF